MSPSGLGSARRRRGTRAYTAIEVLMSLSVLAVGVIGIFSMEKVTIASNAHAKNLSIATHVAQGWLGMLETEATLWDASPGSLSRTTWLQSIPAEPNWFRPAFSGTANFGPDFDELGNPVPADGRFCADLRLSRLNGTEAEAEGSAIWRTEVRVYWLRDTAVPSATLTAPEFPCDLLPVSVSLQPEARLLHFVHLSGAVRQVVP